MTMSKSAFPEADRRKLAIRTGLATTGLALSWLVGSSVYLQALVTVLFGYLITGDRYQWLYILSKTWFRDYLGISGLVKIGFQISVWEKREETVASVFTKVAEKNRDKVAFIMGDISITFAEGEELSNRIAWFFKKQGFKRGDVVAVIMETHPHYPFVWLGLTKIGVVAALINHNLRRDSLTHCVTVSKCTGVIYGDEMGETISEVRESLESSGVRFYEYATKYPSKDQSLSQHLYSMPSHSPMEDIKAGRIKDKALYIFTSGTTGFPKAAIITNIRCLLISMGIHTLVRMRTTDIVYDPLPLYHTAGGILGVHQALVMGCTVVMRKKFSASNFWSDCVQYKCTVAQYIGEMCRYLVASPVSPADRAHRVRLVMGNGLREAIWNEFVERFGVRQISEFYGATEGNSNLINLDSHVGAIGFLTRSAKSVYPLTLVKCDQVTGEIFRDSNGRCIECGPNEPGLFLGKISAKKAILNFAGYADKTESEKKMVRNVLKEGDCYFNTGDILVMDNFGYFYFKDRTGDTFRWRGENVSTTEVESVIMKIVGLKDVVVYGVGVPNTEGKAGMAAIVDQERKINLNELAEKLNHSLPSYARPLFLRITTEAPMTSTFKLMKRELVEHGFDITKSEDSYYFLDQKKGFLQLDKKLYNSIVNGEVRL